MLGSPQPFWSDLDVFRAVRHLHQGLTRLLASPPRFLASWNGLPYCRLSRGLPSLAREFGGSLSLLRSLYLLRHSMHSKRCLCDRVETSGQEQCVISQTRRSWRRQSHQPGGCFHHRGPEGSPGGSKNLQCWSLLTEHDDLRTHGALPLEPITASKMYFGDHVAEPFMKQWKASGKKQVRRSVLWFVDNDYASMPR